MKFFFYFCTFYFTLNSAYSQISESEKREINSYWARASRGVPTLCHLTGKTGIGTPEDLEVGRNTCGESVEIIGGFLKKKGYTCDPYYAETDHTFLKCIDEEGKKFIIDPTYRQFLYSDHIGNAAMKAKLMELPKVFIGTLKEMQDIYESLTGNREHSHLKIWALARNKEELEYEMASLAEKTLRQIQIFTNWHLRVSHPKSPDTQRLYELIQCEE